MTDFVLGYGLGFLFLAIFQGVLDSHDYVRRTWALGRFVLVFLREFFVANISVLQIVLFKSRDSLYPNFFTLDVTGMRPFEILILTYCITLTPGTTSVEIEDEFKTLIVHALDSKDPEAVRQRINRTLKDAILRFTR
jgi:multicomponent Na+:H+ antiporter subunit E